MNALAVIKFGDFLSPLVHGLTKARVFGGGVYKNAPTHVNMVFLNERHLTLKLLYSVKCSGHSGYGQTTPL